MLLVVLYGTPYHLGYDFSVLGVNLFALVLINGLLSWPLTGLFVFIDLVAGDPSFVYERYYAISTADYASKFYELASTLYLIGAGFCFLFGLFGLIYIKFVPAIYSRCVSNSKSIEEFDDSLRRS